MTVKGKNYTPPPPPGQDPYNNPQNQGTAQDQTNQALNKYYGYGTGTEDESWSWENDQSEDLTDDTYFEGVEQDTSIYEAGELSEDSSIDGMEETSGTEDEFNIDTHLKTQKDRIADLKKQIKRSDVPKVLKDQFLADLKTAEDALKKSKKAEGIELDAHLSKAASILDQIEMTLQDAIMNDLGSNYENALEKIEEIEEKLQNPNLTIEERAAFEETLEKMKSDLAASAYAANPILADSDKMISDIEEAGKFSSMTESLASKSNKEPAAIEAIFEKYHIDSNNIPSPPSEDMLMALKEIFENLQEKEDAIVIAQKKREAEELKMQREAASIMDFNIHSTTNNDDNLNTEPFEYIAKAQIRETDEAKAVMEARKEMRDTLVGILRDIYPETNITIEGETYDTVDAISFAGSALHTTDGNGKLTFKGNKSNSGNANSIDAIKNESGKGSRTGRSIVIPDDPTHIQNGDSVVRLVKYYYDWEGDGDLEDRGGLPAFLSQYGYPNGGDYDPW